MERGRIRGMERVVMQNCGWGWRSGLLCVGLVLSGAGAWAQVGPNTTAAEIQRVSPPEEYAKLIQSRTDVAPLGADLFGERLNLYTGALEFIQTDVSIPGAGDLPVSVGRRYTLDQILTPRGSFGDWDLEIPHLHGVFPEQQGWVAADGSTARCTQYSVPPVVSGSSGGGLFAGHEYWQGAFLYLPGSGDQELLKRVPGTPAPSAGGTYPLVTRDGAAIRCLVTLASGGVGEGFEAVTPDGTRYRFDHMVDRAAATLTKSDPAPHPLLQAEGDEPGTVDPSVPTVPENYILRRQEVWLLPTLVTDRHGKTVTYTWDPARPWRLTNIAASDGRSLSIGYVGTTNRIASVTHAGRTWSYAYTAGSRPLLTSVSQPDGAIWSFDLGPLRSLGLAPMTEGGSCGVQAAVLAGEQTGTMTHPSGAKGAFTLQPTAHGRSWVPYDCINPNSAYAYEIHPSLYYVASLRKKEVSGPGLPAGMTWLYAYGPANACYSSGVPVPCSGSSATAKTVTVTNPPTTAYPSGTQDRYTFGNRYQATEGQLQRVETAVSGSAAQRVTTTTYAQPSEGAYSNPAGTSLQGRGDGLMASQHRPTRRVQIEQNGATFTWEVSSDCAGTTYCFDAFARATRVRRGSSLPTAQGPQSRTEQIEYEDHLGKWTLGQMRLVKNGAQAVVQRTFDPATADVLTVKEYDVLQQTLTWNADGTLYRMADGGGNATTFTNYRFGIPQTVQYADGTQQTATVNDRGEITAVSVPIHAIGSPAQYAQTNYDYDGMSRLRAVTYPSGDTSSWNPTTIAYGPVSSTEYGLAAGHWKRTESTGAARRITYFDALWRPRLVEEYDTENPAGTRRFTHRDFDHDGRGTYVSYPTATFASVATRSGGTATTYDGLGRVASIRSDSELGPLMTDIAWQSPFKRVVTDPRGNVTTTTFQAFDQPTEDAPLVITHPASAITTIVRDVYGKPVSTTRSGGSTPSVTRNYVYDAAQRLCKTVEPESGATIQQYDAAGNVSWLTQGSSLTGVTTCDHGSVAAGDRTTFGYDVRNRVTSVAYPGSDSIANTYYADGQLRTTSNGPAGNRSTWTYLYDKRRLLESESLQLDLEGEQQTFLLDRGYDANGALSQLMYPDDTVVAYNPNALGQPRRAGSYATEISYHPNGAMKGFAYGNGVAHNLTQNARQLPQVVQDGSVSKYTYTYDKKANVESIVDGAQSGLENRAMTYDGLDRLLTANAPGIWGNASYTYDAQDNLRTAAVGARNCAYAYDAQNRLTGLTGCSTPASSYGYDPRGNVIQRGAQAYTYDRANRMTAATGKESYRYDGHGRRVLMKKATGGARTYQVYSRDGDLLFGYEPAAGKTTRYVSVNGSLVARVETEPGQTPPTVPNPPSPITTAPNPSPGTYTVSWTANGAAEYRLEESTNGGANWSEIYRGAGTSRPFANRAPGTYAYRARACATVNDPASCSTPTTTATQRITPDPLTIQAGTVPADYTVQWTPVPAATRYRLEQSSNGGTSWSEAYHGPATSYPYTGQASGTYRYRARACATTAATSCGPFTAEASHTVAGCTPPAVPSGLLVEPETLARCHTLRWNAGTGIHHYDVHAQYGSAASQVVASPTTNAWTPVSEQMHNGPFQYRVSACTAACCSAPSAAASGVAACAPQGIRVEPQTAPIGSTLQVFWPAITGTSLYRVRETLVGCNRNRTIDTSATSLRIGALIEQPDCSYPLQQRYEVSACRSSTDCGPYSTLTATVVVTIPFRSDVRTTRYIHTDALRSPVAETDESGAVVKRRRYEAWGAPTDGEYVQGPGYTGHVTDTVTGLSYMQQRYYDPVAGRFLSTDPARSGFNPYWYANNNPYKFIDPDGRYTCKGSDTDCGNFEKAMNFARDSAKSSNLTSEQRDSVQKVVDLIGTPGDTKKVTVTFKDDPSRGGYSTYNKKDEMITLTLRPDKVTKNLGKNAVHEGKHGLTDSERGRRDNTRSERLDNEIGAYTVQGYYQKALRFSTSSDDPWTYGHGLSEKNILNKANSSVNQACGSETGGSCGD